MVTIIDYGVGNLRSVQKAFEVVGYEAQISSDPEQIAQASHLLLPGVGAFADARQKLRDTGLDQLIIEQARKNIPILGICLGMQLLFDRSFEHTEVEGLELIPGEVKKLPSYLDFKIPHIGWNQLHHTSSPLFDGVKDGAYVYFVHSYYYSQEDSPYIIGHTDYGHRIPIAVQRGNLFGVQFHPEKSGATGLQILKNFGGVS